MATIRIDETKTFPGSLKEPENRRESALDFFKRQSTGLKLISDEMEQQKKEQDEFREIWKRSTERKQKLFYDNLDLILRHKDEILTTPRYANIDVLYAIDGGGLYVGTLQTSRQFNIAGSVFMVNLRLATLLRVWETDQFRVECECGCTAFIRSFVGSPLSGSSQATAFCPECKKKTLVANRSFGKFADQAFRRRRDRRKGFHRQMDTRRNGIREGCRRRENERPETRKRILRRQTVLQLGNHDPGTQAEGVRRKLIQVPQNKKRRSAWNVSLMFATLSTYFFKDASSPFFLRVFSALTLFSANK